MTAPELLAGEVVVWRYELVVSTERVLLEAKVSCIAADESFFMRSAFP